MLLALVFVLARNVIKLLVERRRAIPFVRFRAKLVFMLLGMTLIPAVLVLIVGSNVVLRGRRSDGSTSRSKRCCRRPIRSPPTTTAIGSRPSSTKRRGWRRALARRPTLSAPDVRALRDQSDARRQRAPHRHGAGLPRGHRPPGNRPCQPVVDVAAPSMPQDWPRASADRSRRASPRARNTSRWMLGAAQRRRRSGACRPA